MISQRYPSFILILESLLLNTNKTHDSKIKQEHKLTLNIGRSSVPHLASLRELTLKIASIPNLE